ncbi:MAG: adenylate/guanylate cyclase domain-containing protein, partial [Anaerolineae bacterium]
MMYFQQAVYDVMLPDSVRRADLTPAGPPSGTVAFVFTDVEGSTAIRERYPEAMVTAMARHNRLVREAMESQGGYVFKLVGDGACAAFDRARDALAAASSIQRRMHREDWQRTRPDFPPLKVRVGIYTGSAILRDGDYEGRTLNRVARLMAAGHGGQTLLNLATQQLAQDDLPPGVSIRDRGIHWLKDLLHAEHIFELVCQGVPAIQRPLSTAQALETSERVAVAVEVPGHRQPDTLGELIAALRDSEEPVDMSPELARVVAGRSPTTMTEYRVQRVVAWSMPRYRLDRRFVHLTLHVDQGEESLRGRWLEVPREFSNFGQLLEASGDPVSVVLGAPGSGKTTILRRLELELALAGLRVQGRGRDMEPVTFFVELSRYRPDATGRLPDPREWATSLWASRYPNLPPLEKAIEEGRAVMLLDGLNEIPVRGDLANTALEEWKACLQEFGRGVPGNRAIVSCRTLDYSTSLSTAGLRVPQVRLNPLTKEQVRTFLKLYAPGHWRSLWSSLEPRNLDAFRTPFALRLLVDQ